MAIKTVTNENLAQFVADRTAQGSKIASGEQQVAAADAVVASGVKTEGSPTPGNPVIKPGIAETNSVAPDPGNLKPSGKPPEEKTPVQHRIDELTRMRKEADELLEEEYGLRLRAEARVAELEAERANNAPKPEPKPEELKRPSPKDFETQEAYDQAMEAYDVKRDERTRQAAIAEGRQQAEIERQNAAMRAKINAAKIDLPDYDAVIEAADGRRPNIPAHVKAAIFESEVGGHMAYELAKDKDLEARIFKLPVAKALLELGKLEDKIQAKFAKSSITTTSTTQPTVETTRAPAPLTIVRGTGDAGDVPKDLSKAMPFSEYKASRLAQKRRGR